MSMAIKITNKDGTTEARVVESGTAIELKPGQTFETLEGGFAGSDVAGNNVTLVLADGTRIVLVNLIEALHSEEPPVVKTADGEKIESIDDLTEVFPATIDSARGGPERAGGARQGAEEAEAEVMEGPSVPRGAIQQDFPVDGVSETGFEALAADALGAGGQNISPSTTAGPDADTENPGTDNPGTDNPGTDNPGPGGTEEPGGNTDPTPDPNPNEDENDPPDAVNDAFTVGEDALLTVSDPQDILANDSDPEGQALVIQSVTVGGDTITDGDATDLDGDGTNGSITFATAGGGQVVLDLATGEFTYDQQGAFEALNDGEQGSDGFDYTITDGNAADTAAVDITIEGDSDVTVSIGDASAAEGDPDATTGDDDPGTTITFAVTLSGPDDDIVTVDYTVSDGTALALFDYDSQHGTDPLTGTVTFEPGVTSQTIELNVVDDFLFEETETFTVELSNPTNAAIADGVGEGTITDSDTAPALSDQIIINEVALGEGTSPFVDRGGVRNDDLPQESGLSFIELFNTKNQGTVSASDLRNLSIEIAAEDPATGNLEKITIDFDAGTFDGLSAIPARGTMVLYENGTWSVVGPSGSQKVGTFKYTDADGNVVDPQNGDFLEAGDTGFGLADGTDGPLAVNVVENLVEGVVDPATSQSLDLFIANVPGSQIVPGAPNSIHDLLTNVTLTSTSGANPAADWSGNKFMAGTGIGEAHALLGDFVDNATFNGQVDGDLDGILSTILSPAADGAVPADFFTDPENLDIFARTSDGGAPHGGADSSPIDGDVSTDWTTSSEPTENALNDEPGSNSETDPSQGAGTNSGTAGQTVIVGSAPLAGADGMGGRGPDFIYGSDGDDVLMGNEHNDFLFGHKGDDLLEGNTGDDVLVDVDGNDELYGGEGNDILITDATVLTGYDPLEGPQPDAEGDLLAGGAGEDYLAGGAGDDTLWGGTDRDLLSGGGGADWFNFADGDGGNSIAEADLILDFEDGSDTFGFAGDVTTLNFDSSADVSGGGANDTVVSTAGGEILAVVQDVSIDLADAQAVSPLV